ncbi:MAG TPA: AraC family ligand binding domain-containing protein, partial [Thermoanaerobaculia bacterium]
MPGSDAIDDSEARAHHVWSAQIGAYRGIQNSFPAGYRIAEHEHSAATVYLVLRGGHTEVARNGRVDCAAGTVVFSPPGARHADHYGAGGGEAFLVAVPESLLLRGREAGIRLDETVHTTAPNPRRILREIRSEMRSVDDVSPLAVEALMLHILAALHREDALPKHPPRWLQRIH